MSEIAMPQLSESMQEGTILRWLKQDGDDVASEDELVEIETDKAVMTVNAEAEGVLRIVVAEGTTVDVGTVIATIGPAADASCRRRNGDGGPGRRRPPPRPPWPELRRRPNSCRRPRPRRRSPAARHSLTAWNWASSTAPDRAAGSPAPTCWRPLASPRHLIQVHHSRMEVLDSRANRRSRS